jgi:hypothetical protein
MRRSLGMLALVCLATAAQADPSPRPEAARVAARPDSVRVAATTPVPAVESPRLASVVGAPAQAPDSAGAVPGEPGQLPATLRENSYFYGSFGTPDPFQSLLAGDFEPRQQELVDLHTVKLVGVMWETDEIIGMVQDAQGFGYALRPGDAVKNGTVVSVTQDALVARLNIFGQTTQVTLRLQREE